MREVVGRFVERAAAQDFVAVVDDAGTWSARELLGEAAVLAAAVREVAGERPTLLVQSENSCRLVTAALAVGQLSGTIALASSHMSADDIASAIEDIRPDCIVADPVRLDAWQLGASRADVLRGWTVTASVGSDVADRWRGGVVIGMTSGSTGRAKGVVHSEASMRYAAEQEFAAAGLLPGERIGVIVPLSAAPAFAFGIYAALELGSAAVMSAKWDPAAALSRLADSEARWLMCVPTQVLQLAAAAQDRPGVLRHMRAITVGGGPMDVAALADAEQLLGVPILRVFGMAECLGHTTPSLDDSVDVRLGRDGRPFPGTTLRALDEAGHEVAVGVAGHAQVRGPSLFLGYARSGVLVSPELTPDGFFETGDLITRHADGTVSVSGRIKDVIIRGGRNISIAEVESALSRDSHIADVCVVAVPDAVLGERVAALVVPVDPAATMTQLSVEAICARLERTGVAKIKWPEYVIAVDAIPRSEVGKVSRPTARDIAVQMIAGGTLEHA
jgi:non-ribosomal peptide synthetase component E (peptide arylation enzyme)